MKAQHKDAILFFRLGDFYEMFHRDAQEASKILGLTLTKRNGIPMCGIPYHASQGYTARLLKAGRKIAVCEQTKLPEGGKGIAQREVVEVLTPGTILDESMLDQGQNNFLVSVSLAPRKSGGVLALAALDISTGEFLVTRLEGDNPLGPLRRELYRFQPRELIIQESLLDLMPDLAAQLKDDKDITLNRYPDWFFDEKTSAQRLAQVLGVHSLGAFGLKDSDPELHPVGALLDYVQETVRHPLQHLKGIRVYSEFTNVGIDESTQKNLELVSNMNTGTRAFTLLDTLDQTQTPMGARLLKQWILRPLMDKAAIEIRLSLVRTLYKNQRSLTLTAEALGSIRDIERLTARVSMDKAHGKDLQALGRSVHESLDVLGILTGTPFDSLVNDLPLQKLWDIGRKVLHTLTENPSVVLHEGNLIRQGVDPEVDRLRNLRNESKVLLDEFLAKEKEHSGIQNLRIKYNKIIGYHFEVSKGQVSKVPEHFIRRQSLVNAERYTTEELGRVETEITTAADVLIEKEKELFLDLREEVKGYITGFLELSSIIAQVDCFQSLARVATQKGYVEPRVVDEPVFRVVRGRHPVVEAHLASGSFVPNDLELDISTITTALITGPNMAGKSTFLRQNALITIMAQIGSFVPADKAVVGICDKIFCRVGASDNLARGESTFLVEMSETALILQTATNRSFIIMDEVGRGTSTQDGLSLAQAVLEYVLDKIQARTLFATHYHELTGIEHSDLANFSLQVHEQGNRIVFLKKVVPGASSSSYGIHVAQIAGLPAEVIERAFGLLQGFSSQRGSGEQLPLQDSGRQNAPLPKPPRQPGLFDPSEQFMQELKNLDIETITPLQALVVLSRWKQEVGE